MNARSEVRNWMLDTGKQDALLDAYKAEVLHDIANLLETVNPGRSAEFSEGVDWALHSIRHAADGMRGGAA